MALVFIIIFIDLSMDHNQVLLADFQSIVDGKYEEMSTSELSGGARIHYIFQAIFVRSLEVSL